MNIELTKMIDSAFSPETAIAASDAGAGETTPTVDFAALLHELRATLQAGSEQAEPEQAVPEQAVSEQAVPEEAVPEQVVPVAKEPEADQIVSAAAHLAEDASAEPTGAANPAPSALENNDAEESGRQHPLASQAEGERVNIASLESRGPEHAAPFGRIALEADLVSGAEPMEAKAEVKAEAEAEAVPPEDDGQGESPRAEVAPSVMLQAALPPSAAAPLLPAAQDAPTSPVLLDEEAVEAAPVPNRPVPSRTQPTAAPANTARPQAAAPLEAQPVAAQATQPQSTASSPNSAATSLQQAAAQSAVAEQSEGSAEGNPQARASLHATPRAAGLPEQSPARARAAVAFESAEAPVTNVPAQAGNPHSGPAPQAGSLPATAQADALAGPPQEVGPAIAAQPRQAPPEDAGTPAPGPAAPARSAPHPHAAPAQAAPHAEDGVALAPRTDPVLTRVVVDNPRPLETHPRMAVTPAAAPQASPAVAGNAQGEAESETLTVPLQAAEALLEASQQPRRAQAPAALAVAAEAPGSARPHEAQTQASVLAAHEAKPAKPSKASAKHGKASAKPSEATAKYGTPLETDEAPFVSTAPRVSGPVRFDTANSLRAQAVLRQQAPPERPIALETQSTVSAVEGGAARESMGENVVARVSGAPPGEVAPSAQAAAPRGAPALPGRTTIEALAHHTIRNVRHLVVNGERTISVRLEPQSLGQMQIEVHTSGMEVRIRLASQNPMVRDVLEAQVHILRDALARDGIDVVKVEIVPAMTTQSESAGQQSRGMQQQQEHNSASAKPSPAATAQATPKMKASEQRAAAHQGALDVFA